MNKALPLLLLLIGASYAISWDQSASDWNALSVDRFVLFTLQLNASGGASISYSDNSTEFNTNSSGYVTWIPNENFVGDVSVTFNASNTTNQVTNVVTVTVDYVAYYAHPGNISGIGELMLYTDEITAKNNFIRVGVAILITLFVILFVTLKIMWSLEASLLSAATITGIIALIFYTEGWTIGNSIIVLTVLIVIGVLLLIWRRNE